jgi:hypothetical protein
MSRSNSDTPPPVLPAETNTSSEARGCLAPAECAERAERIAARWQLMSDQALAEHERFLTRLAAGTAVLEFHGHAQQRQLLRLVSSDEIREVVECGEPITYDAARFPRDKGPRSIILLGRAGAHARPLHVVCRYEPEPSSTAIWLWTVWTVWDPRSRSYRWSADWTRQLCWCQLSGEVPDEAL